jgi:hypothetical protein
MYQFEYGREGGKTERKILVHNLLEREITLP